MLVLFAVAVSGGFFQLEDLSRISVVKDIDEIINNEIESGYYEVLGYRNTGLIILDYQSREDQNLALGRITMFIEDEEYKEKIVSLDILEQNKKYLLAHDLKGEDIARFFNNAKEELTQQEKDLRNISLTNGIIKVKDGAYNRVPKTAVISFHHDDKLLVYRETMVSHELQHGLDFTSPMHWRESKEKWHSLSDEQKEIFKKFLEKVSNYDLSDENLVITEFRAFTHTTGKIDYDFYINGLIKNGDLTEYEGNILKEMSLKNGFWNEDFWSSLNKFYQNLFVFR